MARCFTSKAGAFRPWSANSPRNFDCRKAFATSGSLIEGSFRAHSYAGSQAIAQFALGRVKSNQVVYFAPRRQPKKGRKKTYGQKCRVDQLVKRFPDRLRKHRGQLHVQGKERKIEIYDAEVLLRGVHKGRALKARVIVVIVPGLKKLKPWYLLTTDLELETMEAVRAYAGRAQVEVNFDEAKELGLGHYQGRSGTGVRRSRRFGLPLPGAAQIGGYWVDQT